MTEEKKITEHNVYDYLTVRQFIKILLDVKDLDSEIYFKGKDGNRLHDVSIFTKEGAGIGCLFG